VIHITFLPKSVKTYTYKTEFACKISVALLNNITSNAAKSTVLVSRHRTKYFTNKTVFKLALRASTTYNEICSSLFVGLALSGCLKVVLFYIRDMIYMKCAQIPVIKL